MGSAYQWTKKECWRLEYDGNFKESARLQTNMEFLRRWILLFQGAPDVEDPMQAMIELEQEWWRAKGLL